MPTEITIPARTETHCEPCQWHKLVGAFHTRSGAGSWREYSCLHPDCFEHMPKLTDFGRPIGKTEITPSWCPIKRKEA